jgi:hypothetical protein
MYRLRKAALRVNFICLYMAEPTVEPAVEPAVVSAFYTIPSKYSTEKYFEWIEPFFTKMPFQLILFTEPALVERFQAMRSGISKDRTIIVGLPSSSWSALTKWKDAWEKAAKKDHEKNHSSQLYQMWYEKKEFVLKAIDMQAFGAKTFVWCDAGILRFPSWLDHIRRFPLEDRIPRGKMTLLRLVPFSEEDSVDTNFQFVNRIGGGIQAADAETWKWWSIQYDIMMVRYQISNRFIGKDQSLMASICLLHPDRVNLIEPPGELDGLTKWFWLLIWLSAAAG